MEFDDHQDS